MSTYSEVETRRKKYTKRLRVVLCVPIVLTLLAWIPLVFPTYVDYYDVPQQDTVHLRLNFEAGNGSYFLNGKKHSCKLKFDTNIDSADFVITMLDKQDDSVGCLRGQLYETSYRGVFEAGETTYHFNFRQDTVKTD